MKKIIRTANYIRIIGGKWRGKNLPVLNSIGLRPTPNRVRETLFNWLTPSIVSTRCLDCFAGSGALGLEALSRYAASSTLLEFKIPVAQQLNKNLKLLHATQQGIVIQTNTLKWLKKRGTAFDIVFVDPPFQQNIIEETVILLEKNGWLTDHAYIYVEHHAKINILKIPANWYHYRHKITGQVAYSLYQRQ